MSLLKLTSRIKGHLMLKREARDAEPFLANGIMLTHHTCEVDTVDEMLDRIRRANNTDLIMKIKLRTITNDGLNALVAALCEGTFKDLAPSGSLSVLACQPGPWSSFTYMIFPTVNKYLLHRHRPWHTINLFEKVVNDHEIIWSYYQPVTNVNDRRTPRLKCSMSGHCQHIYAGPLASKFAPRLWKFGLNCPSKKKHCWECLQDDQLKYKLKCGCAQMRNYSPLLIMVVDPEATSHQLRRCTKFYANIERTKWSVATIWQKNELNFRYIVCVSCHKSKRPVGFDPDDLKDGVFRCMPCQRSGRGRGVPSDSIASDCESEDESTMVPLGDYIEMSNDNDSDSGSDNDNDKDSDNEEELVQALRAVLSSNNDKSNDKTTDNCCVICLDAARTHVMVPCGHKCLCESCTYHMKKLECPMCRKPATDIIKVYE